MEARGVQSMQKKTEDNESRTDAVESSDQETNAVESWLSYHYAKLLKELYCGYYIEYGICLIFPNILTYLLIVVM